MTSQPLFQKIALLLVLMGIVGVAGVSAQTFSEPASSAPNGNVSAPLNTGGTDQQLSGGLWAAGLTAATNFTFGASTWSNESGNITTMRVQQVCINGVCDSSVPPIGPHADITLGATSCNGGWCGPDAYTAAKVCSMNGYSHVVSMIPEGNGGNVCYWKNDGSWGCDGSCTTSCPDKTLTRVSCDNNGTSSLANPAAWAPWGNTAGSGSSGS